MVTITNQVRTGANSTLITYSSSLSSPTFYIYVDGVLTAQTTQTEYTIAVNPGETIVVEILDDAAAQAMQIFPGKARLGWFFVEDTNYYRIDEYIEDEWVERRKMPENNGYMEFESRFLEDGQSHQFRIVPVGTNGNEGTAREFSVLTVRTPDTPDVDYTYSSITNKITISE